jgi:hypothetical protein
MAAREDVRRGHLLEPAHPPQSLLEVAAISLQAAIQVV